MILAYIHTYTCTYICLYLSEALGVLFIKLKTQFTVARYKDAGAWEVGVSGLSG